MNGDGVLVRTPTAAARTTRGRPDLAQLIQSLQSDVEGLVDRVERLRVVSPNAAILPVDDHQAEPFALPRKLSVGGIGVSATDYAGATEAVVAAAKERRSTLVTALATHGLTLGTTEPDLGEALNQFDVVCPDGQPVRWALKWLHGVALEDRVYGPELTLRVCEAAAAEELPVYFYGSRQAVLDSLRRRLLTKFPTLRIAGMRPSRFRADTPEEDADDVRDIMTSGARIVFVGLGCPRQERWAWAHRDRIDLPMLCVGAAFDFHAGTVRQAPPWMQARGLEWLFRLMMEPRRLWSRYAKHNPQFLGLVLRQYVADRLHPARQSVPA